MDFYVDEIPHHLLSQGREVDDDFQPTEKLFIRFTKEQVSGDGFVLPMSAFPNFPNTSVNRSKYGEAEDVLIPVYLDWGIAACECCGLDTDEVFAGDNEVIQLIPKHKPLPTNYPHTEITLAPPRHKSKQVKRLFRLRMNKVLKVIKRAKIADEEWDLVKNERRYLAKQIEEKTLATEK